MPLPRKAQVKPSVLKSSKAIKEGAIFVRTEENAGEAAPEGAIELSEEAYNEDRFLINKYISKVQKEAIRRLMLDEKQRFRWS